MDLWEPMPKHYGDGKQHGRIVRESLKLMAGQLLDHRLGSFGGSSDCIY